MRPSSLLKRFATTEEVANRVPVEPACLRNHRRRPSRRRRRRPRCPTTRRAPTKV